MQAYGKHLVLEVEKPEEKTETGIYLPTDRDEELVTCATVLSVPHQEQEIQQGMKVYFRPHTDIEVNGHRVIRLDDVIAYD